MVFLKFSGRFWVYLAPPVLYASNVQNSYSSFFSKVPIIFFLKQDFASLLDKKFAQCPPIKVLYNFGLECIMEPEKETAKVGPIEWL